ncbi:MAG: thioredoxin [Candidatus Borkfalkiaceae bacterium]|nr:thioredoxin [Christensenellaceae bacterium]
MEIINVFDDEFDREVLSSELPVLVDFWASWCAPCRMQGEVLKELAPDLEGKVKIVKVNVDESERTAIRYGITSIPTLIVFRGGEAVEKTVGLTPRAELSDMLLKYIG